MHDWRISGSRPSWPLEKYIIFTALSLSTWVYNWVHWWKYSVGSPVKDFHSIPGGCGGRGGCWGPSSNTPTCSCIMLLELGWVKFCLYGPPTVRSF